MHLVISRATILERVAPIFEIMRTAAKTEPDIAELLMTLLDERLHNMTILVQSISSHSPLREGLDIPQAAEIVWTVTNPEVFTLLTGIRGWSKEHYSHWLGDTLVRLLIP
jgi:hypothetical protein